MAGKYTNRSVYFPDPEELAAIERAARVAGLSVSELLRQAAAKHATAILRRAGKKKRRNIGLRVIEGGKS